MKPRLLVSRLDFSDESVFYDTHVFELYEELFPGVERDSPDDIVEWVLRTDLGKMRKTYLHEGTEIAYNLESRFFILTLANQAIGFAFVTYDLTSKLLYGNYIAVQTLWELHSGAEMLAKRRHCARFH